MVGWIRFVAGLSLLAVACQAEPPGTPRIEPEAPARKSDRPAPVDGQPAQPDPDEGDLEAAPGGKPKFVLKQYAPQTRFNLLPLRGVGPAGGTAVYTIAGRTNGSEPIGQDGTFCIPVPLAKDEVVQLELFVVDKLGQQSDRMKLELRQSGEPPEVHAPPQLNPILENVVLRQPPYPHDEYAAEGDFKLMTDGNLDPTSYVKFDRGWSLDNTTPPQIMIPFIHRAEVDYVHVVVPADCEWYKAEIYFSDKPEAPGLEGMTSFGADPDANWRAGAANKEAGGIYRFPPGIHAKWMLIQVHNARYAGNCAKGWFPPHDWAGFSEVEVFARDTRPPNAPQSAPDIPSCNLE